MVNCKSFLDEGNTGEREKATILIDHAYKSCVIIHSKANDDIQ